MKIKHAINLHKFLTFAVVIGLMVGYQNFTVAPWVYLALHGSYGVMWLIKDSLYPDAQWEEEVPFLLGVTTFILLGSYWAGLHC